MIDPVNIKLAKPKTRKIVEMILLFLTMIVHLMTMTAKYLLPVKPPTVLPQSNEIPTLVPDGKWFPPVFFTYFIYVCKFTRVNGDYIHHFASNGKTLDGSKAVYKSFFRPKINLKKNKSELLRPPCKSI